MSYEDCLRDAMHLHRVSTPDERCEHLARSVYKMKSKYKQHEAHKKARSLVVLTEAPKQVVEQKYTTNICQSTTLKGKRCTFKATCGNFCKKHSVANKDLVAFLAK
jgi:hypothetical protein